MSVVNQSEEGFVLCHEKHLQDAYRCVRKDSEFFSLTPREHMFLINTPYMKDIEAEKKVKSGSVWSSLQNSVDTNSRGKPDQDNALRKIEMVQKAYSNLLGDSRKKGVFSYNPSIQDALKNNKEARIFSQNLYRESSGWMSAPFNGGNASDESLIIKLGSEDFVFPPRCRFYCRNVCEMKDHIETLRTYDLIVIDPPWWNKYIRRKKAKCSQEGYNMMYNKDLKQLPLRQLLAPGGIIAVWCTNADSLLNDLMEELLPAWGAKPVAQWTWLKVTRSGHPVCPFSTPPGKQPFEQLVFGISSRDEMPHLPTPENGKVFMSVPSAVHSHKPPLNDVLQKYLPPNPRCLEVFARYLVPHWTSWGLEVIKLQHTSLFEISPVLKNAASEEVENPGNIASTPVAHDVLESLSERAAGAVGPAPEEDTKTSTPGKKEAQRSHQ